MKPTPKLIEAWVDCLVSTGDQTRTFSERFKQRIIHESFKKCGIYPVDDSEALNKPPDGDGTIYPISLRLIFVPTTTAHHHQKPISHCLASIIRLQNRSKNFRRTLQSYRNGQVPSRQRLSEILIVSPIMVRFLLINSISQQNDYGNDGRTTTY